MRNVLNILDLTTEEIDELISVAEDIAANPEKYQDKCKHKRLATLFFEPSTRTRLKFRIGNAFSRRQRARFCGRGTQFRIQRRKRIRYRRSGFGLCGYHRHAPPERGRAGRRHPSFARSRHQRGRRRQVSPHADACRSAYHPQKERLFRKSTGRFLRRSEIRQKPTVRFSKQPFFLRMVSRSASVCVG